jgi:DNA-binding NtrC family response regulator
MRVKAEDSTLGNGTVITPSSDDRAFIRGISPAMKTLERMATDLASTDIPILLVGEAGAGKEVFALQIHQLSSRRNEPLAKIHCASMNADSFLASLGNVAGSTGTNGGSVVGSVFFEEISELDAACQRRLLYALPDGGAMPRAGSLRARVISATSRNLEEEVQAGRFRRELYYRINGVCLRLPPLRERKEDIPLLVDFFLTKYAALLSRSQPALSSQTRNLLLEYPWPGNIRELENVVRKIVALGDEQVATADLAAAPSKSRAATPETRAFSLKEAARAASREAEREMIMKVLARTRWNRKRAAQELQISYKSLLSKLKQIGLHDSEAT